MKDSTTDISNHYTVTGLGDRILSALAAAGKDIDALQVDDLAPVDEFHIRGRVATEELASWAAIGQGDRVLDVGCGLGGTSRHLAATTGCEATGVDLTEEYCRVAEMLSERVGLAEQTTFRQGSALDLPFPDDHFDVVWTEHVQMNIADKATFYGEMVRVLKPGGTLAFHDIFAGNGNGNGDGLHFPVPWAPDDTINHLIQVERLSDLLESLGLSPVRWEDKTEAAEAFFGTLLPRVRAEGWMPVGLHLLMGEEALTKFTNMHQNVREGRVRVVQAVLRRGD